MAELKAKVIRIPVEQSTSKITKNVIILLVGLAIGFATRIPLRFIIPKFFANFISTVLVLIIASLIIFVQRGEPLYKAIFDKIFKRNCEFYPYIRKGVYDTKIVEEIADDEVVDGIFIVEDKKMKKKKKSNYDGKSVHIGSSKTAQNFVPFVEAFDNGLFQLNEDTYAIVFRFTDIDYRNVSREMKENVVERYHELLNSLPSKQMCYQEFIRTAEITTNEYREALYPKNYRKEYARVVEDYVSLMDYYIDKAQSSSSKKEGYIALSYKQLNPNDSPSKLFTTYSELSELLEILESKTEILKPEEVFELLHSIYVPNEPFHLPSDFYRRGGDLKDYIAPPEGYRFYDNYIKMAEDHYMTVFRMVLANDTAELNDDLIANLLDNGYKICVSKHIRRLDKNDSIRKLKQKLQSEVDKQDQINKDNNKSGAKGTSYTIDRRASNIREQLDRLNIESNELFEVALFVSCSAKTKEELDEVKDFIKQKAETSQVKLVACYYQKNGLQSLVPFANKVDNSANEYLLTEACAIIIPFSSRYFFEPTGLPYGIDKDSKNLIMIDKSLSINANSMYYGESGGGKSFFDKIEDIGIFLRFESDRIIKIDPNGENVLICTLFKGQNIRITPHSNDKINIFDIKRNYTEGGENAVELKVGFMANFCEIAKGSGITPEERSIIGRCVKRIYSTYLTTGREEDLPTFRTFWEEIKRQPEIEAKNLSLILEYYANGNYFFDGHTNVDLGNRYVNIDLSATGDEKTLSMSVILELVWQQVYENHKMKIRTWFKNDEIQKMFVNNYGEESKLSGAYYADVYARIRKLGGVPNAIAQNFSKMEKSSNGSVMINNSNFSVFFNQGSGDLAKITEYFKLTSSQAKYISGSVYGRGIIKCGNKFIKFDNKVPESFKNTHLYKLISTKPNEKISN